MAFENISKGEFVKQNVSVCIRKKINEKYSDMIHMFAPYANETPYDVQQENAYFIAYCFNIQQRYDISKLEEFVESVETLLGRMKENEFDNWFSYKVVEQLLKQIKK